MSLASIASGAAGAALRLPPPLTREITVRRGLGLRTRDGVILRTDHYAPRLAFAPTVLARTPYPRGGPTAVAARLIAERGFHVLISSCRGTGGSGGRFEPMRSERDDGLDTIEWLRRQPWYTGKLGTFGPSYVGYTQWAIADVPEVAAMATAVTASQFHDPTYAGDSFALFTTLAWASLLRAQEGPWLAGAVDLLRGQPRLRQALAHLPLAEADLLATGREVAFFRRWLELAGARHDPSMTGQAEEYWAALRHDHRIAAVTAPVLMVGGWQDIFLPWQLEDYAALRAAGARPRLTIGPWHHGSRGLAAAMLKESIDWFTTHLRGEAVDAGWRQALGGGGPVRIYVTGGGGWREYDDWPPEGTRAEAWYLHRTPDRGGRLSPEPPAPSEPDQFRYDPADPTPSVGGPLLLGNVAGVRDNREIEARPDVLVYTSETLADDIEIVGPVRASIRVRPSRPHFDIFVRLCDVEPGPNGRSLNVCDGLVRVDARRREAGPDGVLAVEVELWPAAHRFRTGHRLRVQVSGGAYPRYARNLGTPDPLATAVDLRPVIVDVHHDPAQPSAMLLPFAASSSSGGSGGA
ncbi:MAG TPA: CocE/NonD family hydrolase [Micromonosporaceae bacterium]